MARPGGETRRQILDAAERLFAERGVEAVALSEINVAAGQRNNAAAHYHFGTKDALVDAVIDRHQGPIDAERKARLVELEARGDTTLRDLVEAFVGPLVDLLDDASGSCWLQVQAQLLVDPVRSPLYRAPWRSSAHQVSRLVAGSRQAQGIWTETRNSLVDTLVFHGLADQARREARNASSNRDELVATLVDAVAAIVQSPRQHTRRRTGAS